VKIRITTIRQIAKWNLDTYCRDMARNGMPPANVMLFRDTGKTSITMGNPDSETYQTTTYEVLDDVAPVASITDNDLTALGKAHEKRERKREMSWESQHSLKKVEKE